MGWKVSMIIVQNAGEVKKEQVLQQLGFHGLAPINSERFDAIMFPSPGKVYIGFYESNLLICEFYTPMQFIEFEGSTIEKALYSLFPVHEICTIVLHSVVNLWAYAISINGQKVRVRAGSSDDGTFIEKGEPLEEEMVMLDQSTVDHDGNRMYLLDDFPDEPLTEAAMGEEFVFELCKRYFGVKLDSADDTLFETVMEGFTFDRSRINLEVSSRRASSAPKMTKPWWKFWQAK